MAVVIHSNEAHTGYENEECFWNTLKNNLAYVDHSVSQLRLLCPNEYKEHLDSFITDLWNSLTGVFTKTTSYSKGPKAKLLGEVLYPLFPTPPTIAEITYGENNSSILKTTASIPDSLLHCPSLNSFINSYNSIISNIQELTNQYNSVLSQDPKAHIDTEVLLTVLASLNCIFNGNCELINTLQGYFISQIEETVEVRMEVLRQHPETLPQYNNIIAYFNIKVEDILQHSAISA